MQDKVAVDSLLAAPWMKGDTEVGRRRTWMEGDHDIAGIYGQLEAWGGGTVGVDDIHGREIRCPCAGGGTSGAMGSRGIVSGLETRRTVAAMEDPRNGAFHQWSVGGGDDSGGSATESGAREDVGGGHMAGAWGVDALLSILIGVSTDITSQLLMIYYGFYISYN
jgi:hypothetical protein